MAGETIQANVERWLREERIAFEPVADDAALFHVSVVYPIESPYRIDVVQPDRPHPDLLLVGSGVTVADDHRAAIARLTPDDRRDFLWDVCHLLAHRPAEFELQHPNDVLERFSVTAPLYEEELRKGTFIGALREVHRTKLLGIWKIQEFGDEPEGPGFRSFRRDLGLS